MIATRFALLRSRYASIGRFCSTNSVIDRVSAQLSNGEAGRLYAVVYLFGTQYKVTEHDLLLLHHNRPLDIGDRIRLDKVLMIGSHDFTLIGRPMLSTDSVQVYATVIEKSLTAADVKYEQIKRHGRMLKWLRNETTVLRINRISVSEKVLG